MYLYKGWLLHWAPGLDRRGVVKAVSALAGVAPFVAMSTCNQVVANGRIFFCPMAELYIYMEPEVVERWKRGRGTQQVWLECSDVGQQHRGTEKVTKGKNHTCLSKRAR